MNKRQKKKEYKKLTGNNPPPWIRYHGEIYHIVLQKPWGGEKAKRQQERIRNLEGFTRAMTERRKKCRKRNW